MAARPLGISLTAALVLLSAALPASAEPFLVKDLDTSPGLNDSRVNLTDRGTGSGVTYFAAADAAHGVELWRSDGTSGGTGRLTDLCAGRCSSLPTGIKVHAGRVFFKANDGFSGDELWVSDGTPGGERRVRDLCPGPCSATPGRVEAAGGRLLFISYFPESGRSELWRTDGTRGGTVRVKVLCAAGCSFFEPPHLLPIGERALFLLTTPRGEELWATDGTAAGTRSLRELGSRLDFLGGYDRLFPGDGFAWAWDSDGLWRTDGTAAGTILLRRTRELTTQPGELYFFRKALWHGMFFGILGEGGMIRSDGTPEGTFQIASFSSSSAVTAFAPLDGELLFQVDDASGDVLWSTRGTADTTAPKLALDFVEAPMGLTSLGGDRAVFVAGPDEVFGRTQLWTTDGTAPGTRQLPLPPGSIYSGEIFATGDGRALFFSVLPESSLWITDGTEAGTHEARSLPEAPGSSGPQQQAALGGKLVFSAMAEPDGSAPLYVSDGTAAGTGLLSRRANYAASFFPFGGRLLFSASKPWEISPGLWATDGTPAGTTLVTRRTSFSSPALLRGQILFDGYTPATGSELRAMDGRTLEVHLVKDVDLFFWDANSSSGESCVPESSLPVPGVIVGGRLLLTADDGRSGRELWITDGTRAVAAGRLFFTVYNETTGAELWSSTGDAAGTGLVTDLNPGPGSSSAQFLAAVGGALLFTADDGLTGLEPWRTDGTAAGTLRLGDLAPGRDASSPGPYTAIKNVVMTGADDGVHGREPWAIPRAEIVRPPR